MDSVAEVDARAARSLQKQNAPLRQMPRTWSSCDRSVWTPGGQALTIACIDLPCSNISWPWHFSQMSCQ